MFQLSHPYMTTGKTIALTVQTFVGKVMSLLFNMLSRLFITFLPRTKCLLISWLQSPSAVILEPPKIKSISIGSPSICHEVRGPDAMILVFECGVEWMFEFLECLYTHIYKSTKLLSWWFLLKWNHIIQLFWNLLFTWQYIVIPYNLVNVLYLHLFLTVAVTNYHQFSGLKQCKSILF